MGRYTHWQRRIGIITISVKVILFARIFMAQVLEMRRFLHWSHQQSTRAWHEDEKMADNPEASEPKTMEEHTAAKVMASQMLCHYVCAYKLKKKLLNL